MIPFQGEMFEFPIIGHLGAGIVAKRKVTTVHVCAAELVPVTSLRMEVRFKDIKLEVLPARIK